MSKWDKNQNWMIIIDLDIIYCYSKSISDDLLALELISYFLLKFFKFYGDI